jgi:GMP synthase-like glutamine amidotransferase
MNRRPPPPLRPRILFLQNCGQEGIGLYGSRLEEKGIAFRAVQVHAGEAIPHEEDWDAVIVGGTPVSANRIQEHPELLREVGFLKRALDRGMPVLGICFGAQLLAKLLGGGVRRSPLKEIGAAPVRLTAAGESDPLFQGFPKCFPAFQWHSDAFDVPPWGMRLAAGWECPNQGFRLGNAVGVQFHLEVTAAEAERWAHRYADELPAAGKSRERLARECREHEPQMAELAALLLDNFLAASGEKAAATDPHPGHRASI